MTLTWIAKYININISTLLFRIGVIAKLSESDALVWRSGKIPAGDGRLRISWAIFALLNLAYKNYFSDLYNSVDNESHYVNGFMGIIDIWQSEESIEHHFDSDLNKDKLNKLFDLYKDELVIALRDFMAVRKRPR
jgi:hypothetical protein